MSTIATNIRFSNEDYEDLRKMAYLTNSSIASVIRRSIACYKENMTYTKTNRKSLFTKMVDSAVKINTSTVYLIKQGRRFE